MKFSASILVAVVVAACTNAPHNAAAFTTTVSQRGIVDSAALAWRSYRIAHTVGDEQFNYSSRRKRPMLTSIMCPPPPPPSVYSSRAYFFTNFTFLRPLPSPPPNSPSSPLPHRLGIRVYFAGFASFPIYYLYI
jgi:hypothetical protein